mmetsp:Transcript_35363/g.80244  ORF Transcript_35363/g.80244 Transcript_35363/m.80244 type:complete len:216 (+) Transcript_35363:291-938(+)
MMLNDTHFLGTSPSPPVGTILPRMPKLACSALRASSSSLQRVDSPSSSIKHSSNRALCCSSSANGFTEPFVRSSATHSVATCSCSGPNLPAAVRTRAAARSTLLVPKTPLRASTGLPLSSFSCFSSAVSARSNSLHLYDSSSKHSSNSICCFSSSEDGSKPSLRTSIAASTHSAAAALCASPNCSAAFMTRAAASLMPASPAQRKVAARVQRGWV